MSSHWLSRSGVVWNGRLRRRPSHIGSHNSSTATALFHCSCQGLPRTDGSRWILDKDLYNLLHQLDENIPSEPLEAGSKRKRGPTQPSQGGRAIQTPDVDACLELFERRDYLLKMKAADLTSKPDSALEGHFYYSMGPRAMLEIGRRQVIFFCSEILDQEVDPQMLKELADEEAAMQEEEIRA